MNTTKENELWIGWIFRQQTLNDLQWSRIGDFIWNFFLLSLSVTLSFMVVCDWEFASRCDSGLLLWTARVWMNVCMWVAAVYVLSLVTPRFYMVAKSDDSKNVLNERQRRPSHNFIKFFFRQAKQFVSICSLCMCVCVRTLRRYAFIALKL